MKNNLTGGRAINHTQPELLSLISNSILTIDYSKLHIYDDGLSVQGLEVILLKV